MKNLKDIRKSLDLTQKDVAKELNLTRSTYAKLEAGQVEIGIHRLVRLYEYLSGYKPVNERLYDALQWILTTMKEEGFPKNDKHLRTIQDWLKTHEDNLRKVKKISYTSTDLD